MGKPARSRSRAGAEARRIRGLALALFLVACATPALADDLRDFCPNRPGKGSPACILDRGHWQVEGDAVDYARDRRNGVTTTDTSIADFQIRYGLTSRSEVQLSWAPFLGEHVTGAGRIHGAGDASLALRWSLTDPDGKGPEVAIQPFVTAPVGSSAFTDDKWTGGVGVPIAIPLSEGVSLGLYPQWTRVPNASGHGDHDAWSGAAGLGFSAGPFGYGVELWGAQDDDPAGKTRQGSFDLTGTWQPIAVKDTQLDAGLNLGLNHHTPGHEIYLGLAHRF